MRTARGKPSGKQPGTATERTSNGTRPTLTALIRLLARQAAHEHIAQLRAGDAAAPPAGHPNTVYSKPQP